MLQMFRGHKEKQSNMIKRRWGWWLEGEGAWLVRGKGGFQARAEKNGKVEFLTW